MVHGDLKGRLRKLEEALVSSVIYSDALQLVTDEEERLKAYKAETTTELSPAFDGALAHLKYLREFWLDEHLWKDWSGYARQEAARILGCSVDGVLPTTNHLESFNRVLKYRHLPTAQRGGRRLRVDVLLQQLVTKILPSIFEFRALEEQEETRWEAQLRRLPGGEALLEARKKREAADLPSVAYLYADPRRDAAAANLLENKQVGHPEFKSETLTFHFTCYSSLATPSDPNPTSYQVCLGIRGTALCGCPDFCNRGGACKHIRAALLYLDVLRRTMPTMPNITLPSSEAQARERLLLESQDNRNSDSLPPTHAMDRAAAAIDDLIQESEGLSMLEDEGEITAGELTADPQPSLSPTPLPPISHDLEGPTARESRAGYEDFQFSLPGPTADAGRAVASQSLGRVLLQLDKDAPKLNQLASFLKGVPCVESPVDLQRTVDSADHLRSLLTELDRLIIASDLPAASTTTTTTTSSAASAPRGATTAAQIQIAAAHSGPSSGAASSAAESRRRKAMEIMGLSPEKKQKRHKSYSIFW